MFKRIIDEVGRIFSPQTASLTPFTITFGETAARAIYAPRDSDPGAVIAALELPRPSPAIVIMGGAALMDEASISDVRSTLEDGIAWFAEQHAVAIFDGGTDAGVMAMMGAARARRRYQFPLVGVAPRAVIRYPGYDNPKAMADLDANHSHFVLTSGNAFGAESDLLGHLGYALAQGGDQRYATLGLIINGGAIVAKEAHARATGAVRYPLLTMEGSGRYADDLAAAQNAGRSDDPQIAAILRAGGVHVMPINAGAESIRGWLASFFGF